MKLCMQSIQNDISLENKKVMYYVCKIAHCNFLILFLIFSFSMHKCNQDFEQAAQWKSKVCHENSKLQHGQRNSFSHILHATDLSSGAIWLHISHTALAENEIIIIIDWNYIFYMKLYTTFIKYRGPTISSCCVVSLFGYSTWGSFCSFCLKTSVWHNCCIPSV